MTSCDISDAAAWQKLGCYLVITPETLQIHFSSLCGTRLFVVFTGNLSVITCLEKHCISHIYRYKPNSHVLYLIPLTVCI